MFVDYPPEGNDQGIIFGDGWYGHVWYIDGIKPFGEDRIPYRSIQFMPERKLYKILRQKEQITGEKIFDANEQTITCRYPDSQILKGDITSNRIFILCSVSGKPTVHTMRHTDLLNEIKLLQKENRALKTRVHYQDRQIYELMGRVELYIQKNVKIINAATSVRSNFGNMFNPLGVDDAK